jgi:transposase-like protein
MERTAMQEFIRSNYVDDWDDRHLRVGQTNEADLINSVLPSSCPYCQSETIIRKGMNGNHIQRYLCKQCNRFFVPTTGTIFDEHKISIREWISYSLNILRYVSITADSWNNKNDFKTSRYWLQKLFAVLEPYQAGIILSGKVTLDETFYTLRSGDIELKPDGTKPRGLSMNKMCIGVACDTQNIYCVYEGQGKPSQRGTMAAFKDHIASGSTLIHDEEKAHKKLVTTLNLVSESYNSKDLKLLDDKKNPLRRVNEVHARLKDFLNAHPSFIRDELPGYLNVFAFAMNPPHNKLEKMEVLLNLAFQNRQIIRYRDFYQAKSKVVDDF